MSKVTKKCKQKSIDCFSEGGSSKLPKKLIGSTINRSVIPSKSTSTFEKSIEKKRSDRDEWITMDSNSDEEQNIILSDTKIAKNPLLLNTNNKKPLVNKSSEEREACRSRENSSDICFSPFEDCADDEITFQEPIDNVVAKNEFIAETSVKKKRSKPRRISGNPKRGDNSGRMPCPFYKKIPNTNFVVDAFYYRVIGNTCFLSHFHYLEHMGLNKNFPGKFYCNEVTAKLCQLILNVPECKFIILPMNKLYNIEGVEVLTLDANHCPGSAMFLFILNNFEIYLHTGHFRADKCSVDLWKNLEPYQNRVTKLFLDTTYWNANYSFPPQDEIVDKVVSCACGLVKKHGKDNVLFVFGYYTTFIGKERLFLKVAETLDVKVSVDKPTFDILNCFGWPDVDKYVELESKTATIIVKCVLDIKIESLRHLCTTMTGSRRFSHVVGFIPISWSQTCLMDDGDLKPTTVQGNISIYSVPYKEHSNYEDLKQFVQFLRPQEVVPTVSKNYKEMSSTINEWLT